MPSPKVPASFPVIASSVGAGATITSKPLRNEWASGVLVRLNLANRAAPSTWTPSVQIRMADGTWLTIWTAGAAVAASGNSLYLLSNGNHTNIGALTEVEDIPLPIGEWRVVVTFGGGGGTADVLVDAMYVK